MRTWSCKIGMVVLSCKMHYASSYISLWIKNVFYYYYYYFHHRSSVLLECILCS
jgi:hypothetical protein